MTKPFLFLSDFDGTLSNKDFFHVIIDKYHQEEAEKLYADWDKKVMTDLAYLSNIFQTIDRDQAVIDEDILSIPFDPDAKKVIDHVHRLGGDFIVISAGTDYYIKKIFAHYGIENVKIYSNPGSYQERGIQLNVDPAGRYYSEMYGINKQKVAEDLMKDYQTVFFAGDSRPDLEAACLADTVFAKGKLQGLLAEQHHPFVSVDNFADVDRYLTDHEEVFTHVSSR